MNRCPLDSDHALAFEDDGEAYCAEHGVRFLQHAAPMGPQFSRPATEPDRDAQR